MERAVIHRIERLHHVRAMETVVSESGVTGRGIAGVALAVRDLGRVVDFYRDVIGLPVIADEGGAVRLGEGGFLELIERPGAASSGPGGAGLYHTAFLLPDRAALGRWLGHVAATGQALDGAADHLVSEAAYLHDPEGNGVEVYADRPRDAWKWDGTQLRMANARLDFEGLRRAGEGAWTGAPAGTKVGHVHLRVGHAERAARFYAESLGMQSMVARPQAAFLSWDGYHHHLAANEWDSAGAGVRGPEEAGLAWVTLSGGQVPSEIVDPWGTLFRVIPALPSLENRS